MPAASARVPGRYPSTPDGRYFVVRGRLWRCADPALPETRRAELVARLMSARRAVGQALRAADPPALAAARAAVDLAKRALGERGPVWWTDGAPDLNRRLAVNSPYAGWWAAIAAAAEPRPANTVPRKSRNNPPGNKESPHAHPPGT